MRSPSKTQNEHRKAERRAAPERRTDITRAVAGERREVEQRGVAEAMVDALQDILTWERASERVLKAASARSDSDLTKN